MERENERCAAPVDLGAASAETKGEPGFRVELSTIGKALGIEAE